MATFVAVSFFNIKLQRHRAPRLGGKDIFDFGQTAGDHGEQVAWFRKGVFERRKMAPPIELAKVDQIAVGQQHRGFCNLAHKGCPETGHYIRPIGKIGQFAETLCFALGAIHGAREIKSFKGGIGCRMNFDHGLQRELFRDVVDRQSFLSNGKAVRLKVMAFQSHL